MRSRNPIYIGQFLVLTPAIGPSFKDIGRARIGTGKQTIGILIFIGSADQQDRIVQGQSRSKAIARKAI